MRREHIERVLGMVGGDLEKAAELLGMENKELRRWAKRLGITGCNGFSE
jgi:transcriptional regulator with GAF, ATPase, and Fis domain